jgi:chromosome segregation ATPase
MVIRIPDIHRISIIDPIGSHQRHLRKILANIHDTPQSTGNGEGTNQRSSLNLDMSDTNALLFQEKLASLQGSIRKLNDERLEMLSQIDLLKKEKDILLKALDDFTRMEDTLEDLKTRNIELQSQLNALMGALERMENEQS